MLPGHASVTWFVKIIVQLYMLYPIFEFLVFGRAGILSARKLAAVGVVCLAAKILTVALMFWSLSNGRAPWVAEAWKGVNLYGIWPCLEVGHATFTFFEPLL